MAVSSLAIKGLLGVGAISTVAIGIGGTYLYTQDKVSYLKNDLEAFKSQENWTIESSPGSISSGSSSAPVTVTFQLSSNLSGNKTWKCKIQGIIKNVTSGQSLDIETQKTSFGKEIGIISNSKRDKSKEIEFQQFFENCIRNRETPTNENTDNLESAIDLGEMKINDNKYKFEETDLKKLQKEIFFSQQTKERLLGMNFVSNNNSHTVTEEQEKTFGFSKKNTTSITITRSTGDTSGKFENGVKYTIANAQDSQNGDYTTKRDWLGNFKLVKVN